VQMYSFSTGIQRDIGFATVVDVAFVGNLGRHALQTQNLNTLPYGKRFLPSSQDPTNPGKPLPDTPRWRATAAYEHTFHFGNGSTLAPRAQYHYEAGRSMNIQNVPGTYQGGYGMLDASLMYTSSDKTWDLSAWARNLENKAIFQTAGAVTTDLAAYPSRANATYAPPRTLGITLRKRF